MYTPEVRFMEAAIEAARRSREEGDYAVGAVIVKDDLIIARAGNRTRLDRVATAHAEKLAIECASDILGRRHLTDCILYSTHEPCILCCGLLSWPKFHS